MEIFVRNVSRFTVEVTIPLTDESMADPFNFAVDSLRSTGLYPDDCWEDSAVHDRWNWQRGTLTITLSKIV